MSQEDRYYARSWELLTRDKGWVKPLLVMASVQAALATILVSMSIYIVFATESSRNVTAGLLALTLPLLIALLAVVALAVSGYMLEWARLIAWEVDAAPKQRGVRIGECIKAGWRGFVASLGYSAVFYLLTSLLTSLFNRTFLAGLIGLLIMAANVLLLVGLMVVRVHATIYQRIGAGYRFGRIWDMIRRDVAGLAKIAGIMVLIGLVTVAVVAIVAVVVVIFTLTPTMVASSVSGTSSARMVLSAVGPVISWSVPIFFVSYLFGTFGELIGNAAVALWMRQFHVPLWGGSNEPLPGLGGLPAAGAAPYGGTYAGFDGETPRVPENITAAAAWQANDAHRTDMPKGTAPSEWQAGNENGENHDVAHNASLTARQAGEHHNDATSPVAGTPSPAGQATGGFAPVPMPEPPVFGERTVKPVEPAAGSVADRGTSWPNADTATATSEPVPDLPTLELGKEAAAAVNEGVVAPEPVSVATPGGDVPTTFVEPNYGGSKPMPEIVDVDVSSAIDESTATMSVSGIPMPPAPPSVDMPMQEIVSDVSPAPSRPSQYGPNEVREPWVPTYDDNTETSDSGSGDAATLDEGNVDSTENPI